MNYTNPNCDPHTVASFGDEWQRFNQNGMATVESERVFGDYFSIFPWDQFGITPIQWTGVRATRV